MVESTRERRVEHPQAREPCGPARIGPLRTRKGPRSRDRKMPVMSQPSPPSRPRVAGKRRLLLSRVYGFLEPGPVVLLGTASRGRPNVMAMSWTTMLEFEPPLVGCVVSDRNHSWRALKSTRQATINIPSVDIARQVVACGNCSGRDVDKFATIGLTAVPATQVAAPLVAECFANLECRVVDTRMAARHGLFVLEVVAAWVDPAAKDPRTIHHRGRGRFMVAGQTIRLPSRMR
jgi:flavin reductase (DIM6/NTAB) family NADH-FMN oxidoreductase RutF